MVILALKTHIDECWEAFVHFFYTRPGCLFASASRYYLQTSDGFFLIPNSAAWSFFFLTTLLKLGGGISLDTALVSTAFGLSAASSIDAVKSLSSFSVIIDRPSLTSDLTAAKAFWLPRRPLVLGEVALHLLYVEWRLSSPCHPFRTDVFVHSFA